MKQTVAIIGAGEPDGRALALRFARSGCRLLLSDKESENSRRLLAEIRRAEARPDAEVLECARTSCWEADIIVVATPIGSRDEVLEKIRTVSTGKIVAAVVSSRSAGDLYERALPYSRFVRVVPAREGYTLQSEDDDARGTIEGLINAQSTAARPMRIMRGRELRTSNTQTSIRKEARI